MGSLSQAKTLGGIGSILTLLLFVPDFVGAALVIIGWALILWAVKIISDNLQDRTIFNNAIASIVFAIAGTVVFAVVVAAAFLGFIGLGSPPPSSFSPGFAGLIASLIAGLVVVWILAILSSFFLWKSFRTMGVKLNVGLFGTAALIYFIGSILTVILVGFFLDFIAQILFIVAFFTIKDEVQQSTPLQQQTMGTR